jgi:dipeptidase
MCDTLYVAKDSGASAFFGKNSDRVPSEPQSFCVVPARPPAEKSEPLKIGETKFQSSDKGFSYCLSKPSWMAGGEMGINSKGLAIGNEAVFSRFKPAKNGILGMDILRAALAVSATADEARAFICSAVETLEQGGNGAYKGSLYYDNSFLLADASGAFVLETAGHRWAWRKAGERDAISNSYCVTDDYKRVDALTRKEIAPVNDAMACSDESDPGRKGTKESWKHAMENRFYLNFTKGESRRGLSIGLLDSIWGAATKTARGAEAEKTSGILEMFSVLRSHGPYDPARPLFHHMESLCVHSGPFPASATTASMVVEWKSENVAIVWFTGTSYPCLSLYKPIVLSAGEFFPLWNRYDYTENSAASLAYWQKQREWLKRDRNFAREKDETFVAGRDKAQGSLALIAEQAVSELASKGQEASMSHVLGQEVGAVVAGWESDFL